MKGNAMNDNICTVDRIESTLVLMDADGQAIATHRISDQRGGRREAKQVLNQWLNENAFEIAAAMNLV